MDVMGRVACGRFAVRVDGEENVNLSERLEVQAIGKAESIQISDGVPIVNFQQAFSTEAEVVLGLKLG